MSFALRLILGGIPATIIGALWFVFGLMGEDPMGPFTGGLWKGPLLMLAGIGAVVMGVRMIRELRSGRDQ